MAASKSSVPSTFCSTVAHALGDPHAEHDHQAAASIASGHVNANRPTLTACHRSTPSTSRRCGGNGMAFPWRVISRPRQRALGSSSTCGSALKNTTNYQRDQRHSTNFQRAPGVRAARHTSHSLRINTEENDQYLAAIARPRTAPIRLSQLRRPVRVAMIIARIDMRPRARSQSTSLRQVVRSHHRHRRNRVRTAGTETRRRPADQSAQPHDDEDARDAGDDGARDDRRRTTSAAWRRRPP